MSVFILVIMLAGCVYLLHFEYFSSAAFGPGRSSLGGDEHDADEHVQKGRSSRALSLTKQPCWSTSKAQSFPLSYADKNLKRHLPPLSEIIICHHPAEARSHQMPSITSMAAVMSNKYSQTDVNACMRGSSESSPPRAFYCARGEKWVMARGFSISPFSEQRRHSCLLGQNLPCSGEG